MGSGGLAVCDDGHCLVVMKNPGDFSTAAEENPNLDATVESQVSKGARPFDKLRAGSGARPDFFQSTFKDDSRYTRAGDMGYPPSIDLPVSQT